MGEFSLSKRKRNWDRNLSRHCANEVDNTHRSRSEYDSSVWQTTAESASTAIHENDLAECARSSDVKDVNFWTNVFFSSDTSLPEAPRNPNSKNPSSREMVSEIASLPSTSSVRHRSIDGKAAKKVDNMMPSNTAFLLNNVISKMNDQSPRLGRANKTDSNRTAPTQSKYEFEPISRRSHNTPNHFPFSSNDSLLSLPPSYTLLNVIKPRSLLPKRKNHSNSCPGESEHLTASTSDAPSTQRYTAVTGSNFLQTLSELHFDHNEGCPTSSSTLTPPQVASRHREIHPKQKDR